MQRDGISVCIIAKNEESVIGTCLSSVEFLADEIIVVDTGSSDRTVEIAGQYGAKIIHHKWNDDFSDARNTAIANATCRWILTLDCDEVIAEQDISTIKQLTTASGVDGYLLEQRNYVDQYVDGFKPCSGEYREELDYSGYFPIPIVRLFRNHPSLCYTGRVHEQVSNITGDGLNVVHADIPVHHYGKVRGRNIIADKMTEYLKLGEKKVEDNPENPQAHYEYAMVAWQQGDSDTAASAFEKALELQEGDKRISVDAARFFSESGKFHKAREILESVLRRNERDLEALDALGFSYMSEQRYEEAVDAFSRALETDPDNIYALRNISAAYVKMQRHGKAVRYLKRLLDADPKCKEAYRYLGMAYESAKQWERAIAIYRKYLAVCPDAVDFVRERFAYIEKEFTFAISPDK